LAEKLYFISTSHVFGSNTSVSSWELLWRAIQSMINICAQREDLVEKHKLLLDKLKWLEETSPTPELTKAFPCDINNRVTDENGNLRPLRASIYVKDILAAAVIKAIFTVCGVPDVAVQQCSLSLEKWFELILGPIQIVLGLNIDTNKLTVGTTDDYIE
jgi:hypothetical protein